MIDAIRLPRFRIRPATGADLPLCWQLHQDTLKPYVAATWGWKQAVQLARFEAGFDPGVRQIIEIEGRPSGVLQVDYATTPVRLFNMQITPPFQRRGLGTEIVRNIIEQANGRAVWLQVLKVNPARRLYERMGFRITEETATHFQMLYAPTSNRSTSAR